VRIFLAGASGLIGVRLVPLLTAAGHQVAGMTRTPSKVPMLAELGCQPIVCDVYDAARLTEAVVGFAPELVMHQLTDLPDDPAELGRLGSAANSRIRRHGTPNLIAAAAATGATRLLAQSVAWDLEGEGGAAKAELERLVLAAGGVVLRYGMFYGPGTYAPERAESGPYIHVDEAARRTVELLHSPGGIVTIVEPSVGSDA
jgi:uncharacterized protein YbjT (DUF2867 family)